MDGRVEFHLPERGFGFIRYESQPGSSRFDKSVYFARYSGLLSRGDRVEFEIELREDGRTEAVNIGPIADRHTGVVVTTGRKSYCYVSVDGRFSDNQQIFAAFDDVVPDSIGRRALPIGARVSCRIEIQAVKGESRGKERAVDVVNEDAEESSIDASSYREFGQVTFWDGDRGHVVRSSGDTLAFLPKNIISEGIETIKVGSWLQYGITVHRYLFNKERLQFRHRVYATDVCVCLDSEDDSQPVLPIEYVEPNSLEAHFLEAEELPLAPPEPEKIAPGEVYLPSEKKMTLRALIDRKRAA